eukprot:GGOE01003254.1.p1 GENE.GGOE01003254.1~~GGOE01003254.1.p1  ORF type:complete len:582 (-),score=152.27 GGOE01003254.1:216-1961(-)
MELSERRPLLRRKGSGNAQDGTPLVTFGSSHAPLPTAGLKGQEIRVRLVFSLLVSLQVLIHFDAGAIPASLGPACDPTAEPGHRLRKLAAIPLGHDHPWATERLKYLATDPDCNDPAVNKGIIHDFRLGFTQIGLLQSLVYFGSTLSCSVGGSLLQRHKAKWLVATGLVVNVLCMATLATTHSTTICILSRFVLGLAQAFLVMFLPVWIDEYAPEDKCTTWISIAQAGVPIGIMVGYLTSGFLAANTSLNWRYSFWIQICILIPISLLFMCVPAHYVDIPSDSDELRLGSPYHHDNMWVEVGMHMRAVLCTPLFVLTALTLSALYYVVAALQLWITPYVHGPPLLQPLNTIVVAFSLTSATAPVLGLLTGGWFMDHVFGGYRASMAHTAQVALCFGAVATVASFVVTITTDFRLFFLLIWVVLYCGAAAVPCCTGISLCSVPKELRPVASSVGMMVYNLLGWFAGPLLTGVIATFTDSLVWGFRFTMAWSAVSFICMGFVYCVTSRHSGAMPYPYSDDDPSLASDEEADLLPPDMISFASLTYVSLPRRHSSLRDSQPPSEVGTVWAMKLQPNGVGKGDRI